MAREALLTIDCSSYSDDIADIIRLFNEIGWSFRNNQVEYLPLNDNDMFDWKSEELSCEKLFSLISQKQANKELVGVTLYYKGTDTGIVILAHNTGEISINPDINRQTTDGEYTDISWYVMEIVAKLEKAGCMIETIRYSECIG